MLHQSSGLQVLMIGTKFIVVTFIVVFFALFVMYTIFIYAAHDFNKNALDIDHCYDRGGVWNDETNICE